jgi:hypothetical protein
MTGAIQPLLSTALDQTNTNPFNGTTKDPSKCGISRGAQVEVLIDLLTQSQTRVTQLSAQTQVFPLYDFEAVLGTCRILCDFAGLDVIEMQDPTWVTLRPPNGPAQTLLQTRDLKGRSIGDVLFCVTDGLREAKALGEVIARGGNTILNADLMTTYFHMKPAPRTDPDRFIRNLESIEQTIRECPFTYGIVRLMIMHPQLCRHDIVDEANAVMRLMFMGWVQEPADSGREAVGFGGDALRGVVNAAITLLGSSSRVARDS